MTQSKIQNAKGSGGHASAATHSLTAGPGQNEMQLERILARVPPLIALPRPKGRCPYSSKTRTGLLELIAPCQRNNFKPPVRAIYKRAHKYAQRGQWLIPSEDLFRYLLGLAETSADEYLKTAKERAEAKKGKSTT